MFYLSQTLLDLLILYEKRQLTRQSEYSMGQVKFSHFMGSNGNENKWNNGPCCIANYSQYKIIQI